MGVDDREVRETHLAEPDNGDLDHWDLTSAARLSSPINEDVGGAINERQLGLDIAQQRRRRIAL